MSNKQQIVKKNKKTEAKDIALKFTCQNIN